MVNKQILYLFKLLPSLFHRATNFTLRRRASFIMSCMVSCSVVKQIHAMLQETWLELVLSQTLPFFKRLLAVKC